MNLKTHLKSWHAKKNKYCSLPANAQQRSIWVGSRGSTVLQARGVSRIWECGASLQRADASIWHAVQHGSWHCLNALCILLFSCPYTAGSFFFLCFRIFDSRVVFLYIHLSLQLYTSQLTGLLTHNQQLLVLWQYK